MMIPGMMGAMAMQGGVNYDAAIAAITNKTIYARADMSTAPDAGSLSTYPWDNEVSGTDITVGVGSVVWRTNSLNGFRGIEPGSPPSAAAVGFTVNTLLNGSVTFTGFAVERRSGSQGAGTGDGRRTNGVVIGGSDYWSLCFEGRQFYLYTYPGSFAYSQAPFSFTDNVPYVIAWRIDGSGNVRFNFNGTVAAGAGTVGYPIIQDNQVLLARRSAADASVRGHEYIASSVALSDEIMDDAVAALMQKWGIS